MNEDKKINMFNNVSSDNNDTYVNEEESVTREPISSPFNTSISMPTNESVDLNDKSNVFIKGSEEVKTNIIKNVRVDNKKKDYFYIKYFMGIAFILIVFLFSFIIANNKKIKLAKTYCKYLETGDIKYINKYKFGSNDYKVLSGNESKKALKCKVVNSPEDVTKEYKDKYQKELNINIKGIYRLGISYNIKDIDQIYQNKRDIYLVNSNNNWYILNPNIYN